MPTSSSDEDWAKLADAAVSVADGTSAYSKAAEQGKATLERKKPPPRRPAAAADYPTPGASASAAAATASEDAIEELDGLALKIRDALDRRLEQLHCGLWSDAQQHSSPPASAEKKSAEKKKKKKRKKENPHGDDDAAPAAAGAEAKEPEAAGAPATPAGPGLAGQSTGGYSRVGVEDGWIAFFKGVKPGTPCVLEKPAEEAPAQRRHKGWLPSRCLAKSDQQALKRAAEVAVEGQAIISAANVSRKKIKQRLPLDGVVVDPKQHVPFDVRTARLLGMPAPAVVTC